MNPIIKSLIIISIFSFFIGFTIAEVPADIKSEIAKVTPLLSKYSTDPKIVAAVVAFNTNQPAEAATMTNDKWKTLSVLSPEVKAIAKNELSQYLNQSKPVYVSEMFISAANGNKVGFISKPTSFNHKGKPKHDVPMQGKSWTGEVEIDESTGVQQVQIAFPILDKNKPIGSIVIGINIIKLKESN